MKYWFAPILCLFLLSCHHRSRSPFDNAEAEASGDAIANSDNDTTRIVLDTTNLPDLRPTFPWKILSPIMYHNDEVQSDESESSWTGLFKSSEGYYLAETPVKITPVYDAIVDEDSTAHTGWSVHAQHSDTCILLMSGPGKLGIDDLTALLENTDLPLPGDDTIRIDQGDITYLLYADGIKRRDTINRGAFRYYNYKLFLEARGENETTRQVIVAEADYEYFDHIIFMGDLDGDDVPDIILDHSGYNTFTPVLYLSRWSLSRQLLGVAGYRQSTGC